MNYLKIFLLCMILWNIPSYTLAYWNPLLASILSYASTLLMMFYFFTIRPKHRLLLPFIILGILYFTFSSFNLSNESETEFLKSFLRFMILVVCAVEILQRTTKEELFYILLIGALSVIINGVLFPNVTPNENPTYGRFSGFYLNPNYAAYPCLFGLVLSYYVKANFKIKVAAQLLFTLAGILTFSRTFIVIWLILNAIAVYRSRRNLITPIVGALVLILIFTFSDRLTLNTERFTALTSIFDSGEVQTRTLTRDSRSSTWAFYYDRILNEPIIGNGYMKMQSKKYGPGIHNTYLTVLGEAGIIPFIVMILIYMTMLIKSILLFRRKPEFLMMTIVIALALMVGHTYFTYFFNVLLSMYIYIALRKEIQALKDKPVLSTS